VQTRVTQEPVGSILEADELFTVTASYLISKTEKENMKMNNGKLHRKL
jgi:hypothetical protein